ncbi:MAG: PAS domain S-box protein [Armatimonadota bacterium]
MRVLQEREEQERILASIPSILITIDEHDRVTHWNPAAESTFGIPASQALGRSLQQCPVQWDWQPVIGGISICRGSAPVKLDDLRYTRPDGHEGIIGITLTPLGDRTEANGRVLLLGADITERRLMERQFAQALEGVDRVAKIVRAMKEFSHPGAAEMTSVDLNHCIARRNTPANGCALDGDIGARVANRAYFGF